MQDYRRLRVWRKAHAHVLNVRRATNRFPRTGYASLKSQLIRAAESMPFTLVEGCGAHSQKDMARLQYQLLLARDYGVLPRDQWKILTEETIDIRRMLCGLRNKILGSDAQEIDDDQSDDGLDPDVSNRQSDGETVN